MSTLKTTLKIESTTLFPTPVSFTVTNLNTVDGSFSGFINLAVTPTPTILNIVPINGTALAAYCYFKNTDADENIYIGRTGQDAFLSLAPGDVSLISYGGTAAAANLYAYTGTGTAVLSYFIGEKD
jgi:hypothetical protein